MTGPATHAQLLQSIVDVARAIFGAQAASIMLLHEEPGALEFAAVSGAGADTLVGRRIPATTGIAGWVLATREPIAIEDVARDPRFAADVASSTGYVPRGIMSAPLLRGERVLGVLSVLDRPQRTAFSLVEMDLLGAFATQAALALEVVRDARKGAEDGTPVLARLEDALGQLEGPQRAAALRALEAFADLLRAS
ncbi:MAG TPA: GAF domain-containing protein [Solirubrobacteraceae bacterium]|nr:GAF domain-containing protein [Solirubrobacteraceae bacterium]HSD79255.1 GAF domain-containing protein [Solirubrobacteraceae bacterium]